MVPMTYDRLARHAFHRWWLPPIAAVVAVGFAGIATCVVYGVGYGVGAAVGRVTPLGENLMLFAALAMLTPIALAVATLVQRRPPGTLHSVAGRIRWRWLGLCTGIAVAFVLILIVAITWLDGSLGDPLVTVSWPRFAFVGLAAVLIVPLQAAGEEYFFRGLMLQTFGAYSRWVAVAVSAVMFAAAHGMGTGWGFGVLVLNGLLMAAVTIRTGGLEAAIASHAVNNVLGVLMSAGVGGLDTADTTTAADAPWQVALLIGGVDLAYVATVIMVVRMLGRRRSTLAPAVTAPAVTAPAPTGDPGPSPAPQPQESRIAA
jgi:uncharacterized protein